MPLNSDVKKGSIVLEQQLEKHGHDLGPHPGSMFKGLVLYFDGTTSPPIKNGLDDLTPSHHSGEKLRMRMAYTTARFAGAVTVDDLQDEQITHVVVDDSSDVKAIRQAISSRKRLPRVVSVEWVEQSWKERTLLDEERMSVP